MILAVNIFHVLVGILLVLVILAQSGRGEGLSSAFGGPVTASLLGPRTATFLTKLTSVLAALFLASSLFLAVKAARRSSALLETAPPPQPPVEDSASEAL